MSKCVSATAADKTTRPTRVPFSALQFKAILICVRLKLPVLAGKIDSGAKSEFRENDVPILLGKVEKIEQAVRLRQADDSARGFNT